MAKITVKGIDEYAEAVKKYSKNADQILKKSVYAGGGVIADAVKEGLKTLPIQEGKNGLPVFAGEGEKLTGVSRKQKQDLIDSMGLAPIQEFKAGYITTKLGWDGYGSIKTKKYPKGVPNQMLMRSVEGGTEFRQKNPVVRKAVNGARKKSVDAMSKTIEQETRKEFE